MLILKYCTGEFFIAHSQGTTRIWCHLVQSLSRGAQCHTGLMCCWRPAQGFRTRPTLSCSTTSPAALPSPWCQPNPSLPCIPCPLLAVLNPLPCVPSPASPALCQAPSPCSEHSCVCLVHPEWHRGWNSDLSHETVWETKFPLSKLFHVSTSCSASNFYQRRRELSAETCQ